jgi:phosphate transport system protein
MLHRALDAFVQCDVALAQEISDQDDEVDALYQQIYGALMTQVANDQNSIKESNLVLWAAHNLERAADRVTNICERTVFTVTGQLIEMDVEESIESIG